MRLSLGLLFVFLLTPPVFAAKYEFVDATSMGASFNSSAIDVKNNSRINIQAVVSAGASPVGTFKLQATNDGTNYTDITGSDQAVSADGTHMWNIVDPGYWKLRLVYTRTSGSATADAFVSLKDTGVPEK